MTRMYKESGGYMDCSTPHEIKRAMAKGWVVVKPPPKKRGRPRKANVK